MKNQILTTVLATSLLACNNTEQKNQDSTAMDTASTAPAATTQQHDPVMTVMDQMMQDMQQMQMTGDPDKDFSAMMKRHHQGAIEMSNVELQQGSDSMLKDMAQKIVDQQSKESTELETFAHAPASTSDTAFRTKLMQSMTAMDLQMSGHNPGGSIDRNFAAMMIPHHQSAIDMAKAYLGHGKNSKLKSMANKMISDQEREIKTLKQWLVKNQ
jgi:uncharacterized protein (DUF305 family)